MNAIEKRIHDLHQYKPALDKPDDFEQFWKRVKEEALATVVNGHRELKSTYMNEIHTYEVTFDGYAGTTIHATLSIPQNSINSQPSPCLIMLPGYTSERSNSYQHAHWILMGVAVLSVDVRGQGKDTGNNLGSAHGMAKGWITEGLLDLEHCYYKAVAIDLLRALSWLKIQPDIDTTRIGVIGASQGGGLASMLTALDDTICMLVADIPNMCHINYGMLNSTGSLSEVAEFCRRRPEQLQAVLDTLSYFELIHMADRIQVPVLMSVGLQDTVCTPEQIFPFYHVIASEHKQLEIYPFSGHVVESAQQQKAIEFVNRYLMNR